MAKYLDMDGLTYLWSQLKGKLAKKVDKVDGKGLSTNDYTNEERNKLLDITVVTEEEIDIIVTQTEV